MNDKISQQSSSSSFCSNNNHSNKKIQYFCLESSCTTDRLLCSNCIKQGHRKHHVGYIDPLIAPLNRLNMHSHYPASQKIYQLMQNQLNRISQEWQQISAIFMNNLKQLEQGIFFQFNSLVKSFTQDEILQAYQILKSGKGSVSEINYYVNTINFLNTIQLEDICILEKLSVKIADKVQKVMQKATFKLNIIFKKMQVQINKTDFNTLIKDINLDEWNKEEEKCCIRVGNNEQYNIKHQQEQEVQRCMDDPSIFP